MSATRQVAADSARVLGWHGTPIGPVEFGGVRFWGIVQVNPDPTPLSGPLRLVGALVFGSPGPRIVRAASLLAAYTPRTVVVPAGHNLTSLLVDAGFLDQGVLEAHPGGRLECLSVPGPRTSTHLMSPREQRLLSVLDRQRRTTT